MHNKSPFILLILAFCIAPVAAFSQQGAVITGKVTSMDGEILPGANVYVEGLNVGSATDENGEYRFNISRSTISNQQGKEVKLIARYIGYRSKVEKITLQPGTIKKDFSLAEDVLDMEAIVVTGVLGETPKEKLAFTVAKVGEEKMQLAPSVNPMSGLKGKVAGAHVVQGRGTPGTGVSVNLRGSTSITKTSSPLFVVDGVILGANQVDIDALDIESMEVVKGAAAASIWGARAANGIITIRTKRGSNLAMNQTHLTIRSEIGLNQIPLKQLSSQHHEFKIQNGQFIDDDGNPIDFGDAVLDDDEYGVAFQDHEFPGKLYDHLDMFFDPGTFYRNSASLSHNSGNTNYRLSFGALKEPGVVMGQKGYRRQNLRLNFDHYISPQFRFNFTGYYSTSKRDDPFDPGASNQPNPFYGLMFLNPNVNLLEPNDDGTPFKIQPDPRTLEENPLYAINNAEITFNRQRIQSSLTAHWSPWTWVDLEGNFSFDRSDRARQEYYFRGFKTIDGGLQTGRMDKVESYDQAINASLTATITRAFGDLTTRTQLRYLIEDDEFDEVFVSGQDLTVNDVRDLSVVQGDKTINSASSKIRSAGYYFITGIDYRDKYIADFMVRRDGSSLFGPKERWNTYFRVSAAYRMAQESWWFTDKINEFKLRYSLGTAGGRPSFADQYETFTVSSGQVSKGNLGNKKLKPEFATEQEFGLNIAFFDRIGLEIVYAKSVIEDQLLNVPLAGYYGFSNQWQNAGTLENNTWEATLDASILRTRDMSWSAGVTFDHTQQKITEFDRPAYRVGPGNAFYNRKGEVFGSMYGHLWMTDPGMLDRHNGGIHANSKDQFAVNDDGLLVPVGAGNSYKDGFRKHLWGTKVEIDGVTYDWGMPIVFINEDGSNFNKIGDVVPDFNLGFNTTFKWKNFSAYVLFDAEVGGDIYNNTRQWAYRELRHIDVDQAGKPQDLKKPIDYYAALYDVNATSSWFVEEGTYLKLRELNLSYRFNRLQLTEILGGFLGSALNQLTVGVIGRNLVTWTDYSGFDPEVGQSDATLYRYDGFRYPNYRTFTGYIEIQF